ncbi:MAG TPA: iron chelate uptake ABC transporter family permease subunit, partial [Fimbriimonadaceae bacterium]|nr:iron chelate uptake ABC transporter family permease subunit [Fimbriimonadaceae bacterium]
RIKSLPVLLLGALATGLVGLVVLAYVRRNTRTKDDAAMGMILAIFFGAGIALSRFIQNTVTDGSHAGLDSFIFGKTAGMVLSDVALTAGVAAAAVVLIALLYKEFQLVCFDSAFAQSLGWRIPILDLTILALLALAVVVGLPMVGVVMVAALTIIPPVSARFWVKGLRAMLVLSSLLGAVSAVIGVWLSAAYAELPSGPMIVLVAAGFFVMSALFSPSRGVLSNLARLRRLRIHHGMDALLSLLRAGPASVKDVRRYLDLQGLPHSVLAKAATEGLVSRSGERVELATAPAPVRPEAG